MSNYIFINPFCQPPENYHNYDNIQGAYTYIMRNWNCKRSRAKEIYTAVNNGIDISNWKESKWLLKNRKGASATKKKLNISKTNSFTIATDNFLDNIDSLSGIDSLSSSVNSIDNYDNSLIEPLATTIGKSPIRSDNQRLLKEVELLKRTGRSTSSGSSRTK